MTASRETGTLFHPLRQAVNKKYTIRYWHCICAMKPLKSIIYIIYLILVSSTTGVFGQTSLTSSHSNSSFLKADTLFNHLHLGKLGLARRAYDYAIIGYNILKAKGKLSNPGILSIVDFTLPSSKKRLFVIDMLHNSLLFVDYVAHGRNSGMDKAIYFSNEPESFKSSLGFYTTIATYMGKHGYSLQLEGHEVGFNNNARNRDIVMHSTDYVSATVVKSQGYLGRSLGCPALSPAIAKSVIDNIKNGTCLFIYGNESNYIMNSGFLKQVVLPAVTHNQ